MRIAISGSHRTGKSTLLAALAAQLPGYETVDEPYYLMEEDGYEFSHLPSVEDFTAQLERSIAELKQGDGDVLFDRSPIDFLGYIAVDDGAGSVELDAWLPAIRDAIRTLDLVVFVPIEARDRIRLAPSDDDGVSRGGVDEAIRGNLDGRLLRVRRRRSRSGRRYGEPRSVGVTENEMTRRGLAESLEHPLAPEPARP